MHCGRERRKVCLAFLDRTHSPTHTHVDGHSVIVGVVVAVVVVVVAA